MPEHLVATDSDVMVPEWVVHFSQQATTSAPKFFARLPAEIDLHGVSMLDVGCGRGELCAEALRRGARRVLGVEIDPEPLRLAQARAATQPGLDLRLYGGDLDEIDERFDLVTSKDCFEHYGADPATPSPEEMVGQMVRRLRPGGLLAVGFGPLWKGPTGGHIDTRFPWAHLVFPESVIFDEFRRTRPPGKTATTFESGVGVNRMTLARFRSIMRAAPLECVGFRTNVSDNPVVKVMDVVSTVPPLEEYFTANVYGVWRKA